MATVMSEMSAQEAMDALRALKGARDALMGFDAALSKIGAILRTVDEAEDILAQKRQALVEIGEEIRAATERQRQAVSLEEKAARHLADVKEALALEEQACMAACNELRVMKAQAEADVQATVDGKRAELDALDAQIREKTTALGKLHAAFNQFKSEHGLG